MNKKNTTKREMVGIMLDHFSNSKNYSGSHGVMHFQNWLPDEIIRDENEIKELLELGAPMEIYERVHRTGKD